MARTRASSRIHMSGRSGKRLNNREQVASGRAIQPLNPYFVTRPNRTRNELHVPRAVVGSHNLDLPSYKVFIDEKGRKFPAKLKKWKDGRMVYTKGWKNLCSLNLLGEEDKIICQFIREPDGELSIHVYKFCPC